MLVRRYLRWSRILRNSRGFILYTVVLAVSALAFHEFQKNVLHPGTEEASHFRIPFALVAALETALAIFLAFRNNSAYDRWWEARIIWGAIVNESRTFARQVTTFLIGPTESSEAIARFQQELVYRHLAWINALRLQLRKQATWEEIEPFIEAHEFERLMQKQNKATQLLQRQGERIRDALQQGLLGDFRHARLDVTLTEFFNQQGKAERIKNTPLPRQYDYFPRVFLFLFAALLPFGMVSELSRVDSEFLVIVLSPVISFMFYVLMRIGELNEDPFEDRYTDTPMTALCRTIEIDLREQLGEVELPAALEPVDGVLL